ncbi:MAG: PaaI family thioesterase [Bacteroidetes bacterium]|nr:PaaI family thioesterase [Bacteroidota bacterium]MDA0873939.1 PaaI family thioesterase [Bacteroidota bacterium]
MPSIWKKPTDLKLINSFNAGCMVAHIGISFTEIGEDHLTATMPVDERTTQPLGLLHGGATASLLETVASVAATWAVDEDSFCVGVELNINHLRAKRNGQVAATARPLRIGGSIHVWQVDIVDEQGQLVSSGRLTLAVRQRKAPQLD